MSNEDLARRVVRSKHWRWMPGMLTDVGERVTDTETSYLGTLPDLTDPATVGCLLALVLLAYRDMEFRMTYSPSNGWWCVYTGEVPERQTHMGLSQAAVLVAALRAAP